MPCAQSSLSDQIVTVLKEDSSLQSNLVAYATHYTILSFQITQVFYSLMQNMVSACSRRTKSDPGLPLHELHPKEVVLCNPSGAVLTHATLSTVTNGPGSPLYRQIDAAATRRNLETIVQVCFKSNLVQARLRNSRMDRDCPVSIKDGRSQGRGLSSSDILRTWGVLQMRTFAIWL